MLGYKDPFDPIWHGGHDAPSPPKKKMFLTTMLKRLGGGSWNFLTFNINLWSIKKVIYVIQCYHSNKFVREYSRFSEVIVPYVSL